LLKTAQTPAALLEAGVIVNREEEKKLSRPDIQATIARAVGEGLRACLAAILILAQSGHRHRS
jgi:N-acetylmuramoyl-L-alanine amidase